MHQTPKYRSDIDIIRAISVIGVVLYHLKIPAFKSGFLGVDVFLVISGYLITRNLKEKYTRNFYSLRKFYFNRFKRLFPTLVVTLILSSVMALIFFTPYELRQFRENLISSTFFVENFYLLFNDNYFGDNAELNPLLHLWSLSIEEQFYLFFPFIVFFIDIKYFKPITWSLFIISITSSLIFSSLYPCCNFYLTTSRIWEILLGTLVYIYYDKFFVKLSKNKNHNFLKNLCVAIIIFSFCIFNQLNLNPGLINFIPTLSCAIYLVLPGNYKQNIISKIMVDIGRKSYTIYLIHWPLIVFFLNREIKINLITLSVGIYLLSAIVFHLIENPIRYGQLLKGKSIYSLLIIPIILFVGISLSYQTEIKKEYNLSSISYTTFAEHSKNLTRNIEKYSNENFVQTEKKNLLIVGDSFALDIINIISNTGIENKYEILLVKKTAGCGNFYNVSFSEYYQNIISNKKFKCYLEHVNLNPKIENLALKADHVWFVSSVEEWQVEHTLTSLENLQQDTEANILFIGNKNFVQEPLYKIIDFLKNGHTNKYRIISNKELKIENDLSRLLKTNYLSMYKFFEEESKKYPVFIDGVEIFSYDGSHLTLNGAKYISKVFENAVNLNQ